MERLMDRLNEAVHYIKQRTNFELGAHFTKYIRDREPSVITVSVGA